MKMEVGFEGLAPGMQDGGHPEGASQMGSSKVFEGAGDTLKQHIQEDSLVGQDQGVQFMRHREHKVEVTHGEEF